MEIKNYLFILIISVTGLFPTSSYGENSTSKCSQADSMACKVEIISWVEVRFIGSMDLSKYKREFEELVRLRLRNDLSILNHEVKEFLDAYNEYGSFDSPEMKKRGSVECAVGTSDNGNMAAIYTECKLSGYGDYSNSLFDVISSQVLILENAADVKDRVETMIRQSIKNISIKFFNARDRFKSFKY